MALIRIAVFVIIYMLTLPLSVAASGGVIINEVLADPVSESRGEFIELYNAGEDTVDISGWELTDLKDHNDVLIEYTGFFDIGRSGTILYPGHFALIVDPDYDGAYNDVIGEYANLDALIFITIQGDRTLGNGLGNSGDSVFLSVQGRSIDTFTWNVSSGGNGISWEKIKITAGDSETNKSPSTHNSGATPGFTNSVVPQKYGFFISPDTVGLFPPQPEIGQPSKIILRVHNTGLMDINAIRVKLQIQNENPTLIPFNSEIQLSSGDQAYIHLNWLPEEGGDNQLSIFAEIDGIDEVLQDTISISVRVPFPVFSLLMTEIMFNPGVIGTEWLEMYNPNDDPVDIKKWGLSHGIEQKTKMIIDSQYLIPARTYIILTQDSTAFMAAYPSYSGIIFEPAGGWYRLNNTGGSISLIDLTGRMMHTVAYEPEWSAEAGRSAERVHLEPGKVAVWGPSAAESGATPGVKNSLFLDHVPPEHHIGIQPNPFSPDNDGKHDACIITLKIPRTHGILYAVLFDITGRSVKILADQSPVGSHHTLIWSGKDDQGNRLPSGPYVLFTEVLFSADQQVITSKKVIVIAPSI